jgi:UDP-N-acetylmuramoyl-tripeptide--D-alanyl-D-alanine ligase
MPRRLRRLRWLLGTWPGRLELRRRQSRRWWPIAAALAGAYRRTLARRVKVVVVVGSVGKTTTTRAVAAALGAPVSVGALLNANSYASVAGALLSVRPWQRWAVIEVGIGGRRGDMARHARYLRPDIVVVTAIASDHWRTFGTLEATRDEKADMLRALKPAAWAIVNADDANVRWMATQTSASVILAGTADDADVRATDICVDWPRGMRFVAGIDARTWPVRTRLLGQQMVFPALAAMAVADIEGVPVATAIDALAALEPAPGRMQTLVLPSGAVVVRDDFKATEASWDAALSSFAAVPAERRIVVVGGVSEERGKDVYRAIGRRAGEFADLIVVVGPSRYLRLYRVGATAGGLASDRVIHARDWQVALALLRDELRAGDAVLIRGRWQEALARIALALAGRDVQCRADPCPFKRMLCDVCPFLEQPFAGFGVRR